MFIIKHLKKISLSEERNFGLDLSFVTVEKVPKIVNAYLACFMGCKKK
jgi:KUP system potassium uptake protein